MVDHEVRLERMLKEDKKRKKQLTLPLVGAIVLTFFYIWTTNVFLLYAMIFFGQFPALYKSWHRKKLLLSFNEDKPVSTTRAIRIFIGSNFAVTCSHTDYQCGA